jgi:type IV pilus assembly protein PilE
MTAKKSGGFTLIELMIVLAIIGILASIAYPSYVAQVQKSRRADCEAALMQFAGAMERDSSRNTSYRDIIALGTFPAQCPLDGGTVTYNLAYVGPVGPTTFTLSATPTGAQANDTCGTLTLTNTLQKGQSSGTLSECWK